MNEVPAFSSANEAIEIVCAGLSYLAATDAAALSAETQARCLRMLERSGAISTAARASVLAAFTAGQGYSADADYSPRSWLIHQTKITEGAAAAHTAWARRADVHPEVMKVLAVGDLSESFARTICKWTDKLPDGCRDAADTILVGAAVGGLGLRDVAALAAQLLDRYQPQEPDPDTDGDFDDRAVRLDTTFEGAGVLRGDLTPECAAALAAVLDVLSAPAGAEDTRSQAQRYHDALQEAMQRLLAAGLLPGRAGQPVKAWVHVSLADLMLLEGSSTLLEEWTAQVRAGWAAHRAEASVSGNDGGAWLDGDAARAAACDAAAAPVVTGEINFAALDDLVRLCVELARLRHDVSPGARTSQDGGPEGPDEGDPAAGGTARTWEAIEQAVIGKAVDLLSGPSGLASFLRRRQLGARLGGPSLPLDIGYAETVPAGIRNAVVLRDKHCRWAGGCHQPASACHVHHIRHKANGGKTSVTDCVLLCAFHHLVAIHRWGWTLVLNPDGTTTAWNPDRTKILHSHGPPARAG